MKFYEIEGRFPAYPEEISAAAVEYVASLVEVEPGLLAKYSWRGRTIERHRAQIRKRLRGWTPPGSGRGRRRRPGRGAGSRGRRATGPARRASRRPGRRRGRSGCCR
ncbi:DUF4158 domain-containing protein [Streptosporangium sp. KLBMP 9127]|nr:DUF4158 domain-containing protein [Streptosporangium sp. KLBMP 9127]